MRKKHLLMAACAALAVGAWGIGSNQAAAQCGYGGGYGGYATYGGYGGAIGYSSYGYPRSSYSVGISYNSYPRVGYSSYGYGSNRMRGHYDWHPTTVRPHGNHYHVRPGHWDYHRGHRRVHLR